MLEPHNKIIDALYHQAGFSSSLASGQAPDEIKIKDNNQAKMRVC
jgi:hypothetical protein